MRRELDRRLAALEARGRSAALPVDDTLPDFDAWSTEALDAYLADPPPPAAVAAEFADLPYRLERMTDHELDEFLAEMWAGTDAAEVGSRMARGRCRGRCPPAGSVGGACRVIGVACEHASALP